MNNDNVLLVIGLVIGIVVLANLAMFAAVRGWRGTDFDLFKDVRGTFRQPFKKEDDSLEELHRRVEELTKNSEKQQE